MLGVITASGPSFELSNGIPRARIGVDNDIANLSLSGKDDPAELRLNHSALFISDQRYNQRIALQLSDKNCALHFSDASGELGGIFTQDSQGGARILLTDANGETRAV